jgi:hypothetical protein
LGGRWEERAFAGGCRILSTTILLIGVRQLKLQRTEIYHVGNLVKAVYTVQMPRGNVPLLKNENIQEEGIAGFRNHSISFDCRKPQRVQRGPIGLLERLNICGIGSDAIEAIKGSTHTFWKTVGFRRSACKDLTATEVTQVTSVGVRYNQRGRMPLQVFDALHVLLGCWRGLTNLEVDSPWNIQEPLEVFGERVSPTQNFEVAVPKFTGKAINR